MRTTPAYTSASVAPGEAGEVTVTYDSDGRPGPFEKAAHVVAGEASAVTLRIEGTVVPALARTGTRLGSLAFDRVRVDLGLIPSGEAAQTSFQFANVGARPIRIQRVEAPVGVDVAFTDRPVFVDDVRGLFVTVEDPASIASPSGEFSFRLMLHTTDADGPAKEVQVVGQIGPPRALPEGGE